MRIKPKHVVYSIMRWPRIIYKIIKIIPFIVIIVLLFYVILYGNSATNLQYNLLNVVPATLSPCMSSMSHGRLSHTTMGAI